MSVVVRFDDKHGLRGEVARVAAGGVQRARAKVLAFPTPCDACLLRRLDASAHKVSAHKDVPMTQEMTTTKANTKTTSDTASEQRSVAASFQPRVVLAATDLSAPAHEVLLQAHQIAVQHSARLIVLHVIPHGVGVNMLFPERTLREVRRAHALLEDAELMLRERVALLTGRCDGDVELRVTHGEAATEVLRVAHDLDAGLVVIGGRGGSLLSAAFGGTAKKIVRGARMPVLVARPHRKTGVTLAATDFASAAVPALRAGAAHPFERLVFFHCIDYLGADLAVRAVGAELGGRTAVAPEALLDLARRRLIADAVDIGAAAAEARVELGRAATEILRAADEEDADFIVVRDDRRGPVGRLVFGSVAERVAMRAGASVLVVGQELAMTRAA